MFSPRWANEGAQASAATTLRPYSRVLREFVPGQRWWQSQAGGWGGGVSSVSASLPGWRLEAGQRWHTDGGHDERININGGEHHPCSKREAAIPMSTKAFPPPSF